MKPITFCAAKRIVVDCKDNDDVKGGGPRYLGYDFYVKPECEQETIEFIKQKLSQYGRPLIRITSQDKQIKKSMLWRTSQIEETIRVNSME